VVAPVYEVKGRKVLVVGLARSGVAAAKLAAREGAIVTCNDRRPAAELESQVKELLPHGVRFELGGHDEAAFAAADLVIVSPGVPLANPVFAAARRAGVKVIGEVEFAAPFVAEPIVGVTGTNGKSTTTALTAHLLAESGLSVFAGGNLGTPLAERVLEGGHRDVSVVELSSYQLEAVETLRPRVAVVTNLTPDHLDRYPSPEAYYAAKGSIFRRQGADDFAVLNAGDPKTLALHHSSRSAPFTFGHGDPADRGARDDGATLVVRGLPGSGAEERYGDLGKALRGAHNRENAMAAVLAARLAGASVEACARGLATYPGLPHRLELVAVRDGVEWINDSKATNVDSTFVALRAFAHGVIWIAGGLGKKAPYAPLAPLLPGRVKALLTIGDDAPTLGRELGHVLPAEPCGDLATAVRRARELALPGDTVLLSPACASFDQFKSYEHRGAEFRRLVGELP
jgi:UDP-N-acetylmuramoylalanine--D-glutamate ligase